MIESILLRVKPKLEVTLKEDVFEVTDSSEIENTGIYSYSSIESIVFKNENVNWPVTIASNIIGILIESGLGDNYKDKAYLEFILKDKTLKLWLINSDIEKAELLKNKLDRKITLSQPTSQNT